MDLTTFILLFRNFVLVTLLDTLLNFIQFGGPPIFRGVGLANFITRITASGVWLYSTVARTTIIQGNRFVYGLGSQLMFLVTQVWWDIAEGEGKGEEKRQIEGEKLIENTMRREDTWQGKGRKALPSRHLLPFSARISFPHVSSLTLNISWDTSWICSPETSMTSIPTTWVKRKKRKER